MPWMTTRTRRAIRAVLALGYFFIATHLGPRYPLYTGTLSENIWRYGFTLAALLLATQLVVPRWLWSLWLYEAGAAIALVLGLARATELALVVIDQTGSGAMVELGLWGNLLVLQGVSFVSSYREVKEESQKEQGKKARGQ